MIRRPWLVVAIWVAVAGAVWTLAPDLTRLAADSFGTLLPDDAESMRAKRLIRQAWPNRSQDSVAIAVLERSPRLNDSDHAYARRLAERFEAMRVEETRAEGADPDRRDGPRGITRVLGPRSDPEVAKRLISADGTTQLVVAGLDADWVAPRADELVRRLQAGVDDFPVPDGLRLTWSGDAALGSAYMDGVRTTLDRAAYLVVALLFVILMIVYRSVVLALVPLMSIGLSLVIARGLVGWLDELAGLDANPLVELFLIAVLFGTGTDLVLLLTWRFAERWDGQEDPAVVVAQTRRHEAMAMISSAGTLIVALGLLGFMRFKLFNQTGPSVALGMAVGLLASLTLAPALLLILARHRPTAFAAFRRPSTGFWHRVGERAMAHPLRSWAACLVLLAVPAAHALRVQTTFDMVGEIPPGVAALRGLHTITEKFGAGEVSPLTVVIEAQDDWRKSKGLYLIDDLSRQLDDHDVFGEVRSATQPLGSRDELKQARIGSRLGAVRTGLDQIRAGADLMAGSFTDEAAKIRILLGFQQYTGFRLPGLGAQATPPGAPDPKAADPAFPPSRPGVVDPKPEPPAPAQPPAPANPLEPRTLVEKLTKAAEGARMIADGTRLAYKEIGVIVEDPVGIEAVDRLLLTEQNIKEHPELKAAFEEYVSGDGKTTRIDAGMTARMHSERALDQADELFERAANFDQDHQNDYIKLWITGPNITMADVRRVTNQDMRWAYVLLPLGIFLTMLALLRDVGICLNLVATILLTYGFTIGVTDWIMGGEGLDWKVKFFVFVLMMAIGVDYNIFLVTRMRDEVRRHGLRDGIVEAVGHTGALITSAAAITISSYLAFLASPLSSLRGLGLAVGLGIAVDALIVRPVLMPCGHWLMFHAYEALGRREAEPEPAEPATTA